MKARTTIKFRWENPKGILFKVNTLDGLIELPIGHLMNVKNLGEVDPDFELEPGIYRIVDSYDIIHVLTHVAEAKSGNADSIFERTYLADYLCEAKNKN